MSLYFLDDSLFSESKSVVNKIDPAVSVANTEDKIIKGKGINGPIEITIPKDISSNFITIKDSIAEDGSGRIRNITLDGVDLSSSSNKETLAALLASLSNKGQFAIADTPARNDNPNAPTKHISLIQKPESGSIKTTDVNLLAIATGVSILKTIPPITTYHEEFLAAAAEANRSRNGLAKTDTPAAIKTQLSLPTDTTKWTDNSNKKRLYNSLNGLDNACKGNKNSNAVKIGDVWLVIPPTHVTISQMRTSYNQPVLGLESKPLSSPTNRIVIKFNCIFSGEQQVKDDMIRILTQFRFNPINIIQSRDLFERLKTEASYLKAHYSNSWAIPVTMDSYTVYSVEGHPGTFACMLQFSLFNYSSYFVVKDQRMEYYKWTPDFSEFVKNCVKQGLDKVKDEPNPLPSQQKGGESIVKESLYRFVNMDKPNSNNRTLDLEQAFHPYNASIEDLLATYVSEDAISQGTYDLTDSYLALFKIKLEQKMQKANISTARMLDRNSITGETTDSVYEALSSYAKLEFSTDIANNAELVSSISVTYENQFAWQPILGCSQPSAQYIGPGETQININLKTQDTGFCSQLLKSYNETLGNQEYGFFDDRYFIDTTLLNLLNINIVSIQNVGMTSVENHPGMFDVNIICSKSMIEYSYNKDPAAEQDIYWGMQRILAPWEIVLTEDISKLIPDGAGIINSLREKVKKGLTSAKKLLEADVTLPVERHKLGSLQLKGTITNNLYWSLNDLFKAIESIDQIGKYTYMKNTENLLNIEFDVIAPLGETGPGVNSTHNLKVGSEIMFQSSGLPIKGTNGNEIVATFQSLLNIDNQLQMPYFYASKQRAFSVRLSQIFDFTQAAYELRSDGKFIVSKVTLKIDALKERVDGKLYLVKDLTIFENLRDLPKLQCTLKITNTSEESRVLTGKDIANIFTIVEGGQNPVRALDISEKSRTNSIVLLAMRNVLGPLKDAVARGDKAFIDKYDPDLTGLSFDKNFVEKLIESTKFQDDAFYIFQSEGGAIDPAAAAQISVTAEREKFKLAMKEVMSENLGDLNMSLGNSVKIQKEVMLPGDTTSWLDNILLGWFDNLVQGKLKSSAESYGDKINSAPDRIKKDNNALLTKLYTLDIANSDSYTSFQPLSWQLLPGTNKQQTFISLVTDNKSTISKSANAARKKMDEEEASLKSLSADINKNYKAQMEEFKSYFMIKPFSAHRYYPGSNNFVGWSPLVSSTVGDWFVVPSIEKTQAEFMKMQSDIDTAVPLLYDHALYNKKNANTVYDKLHEAEHSVFQENISVYGTRNMLQNFINPQMARDLSAARDKDGRIITELAYVKESVSNDGSIEFANGGLVNNIDDAAMFTNRSGISFEVGKKDIGDISKARNFSNINVTTSKDSQVRSLSGVPDGKSPSSFTSDQIISPRMVPLFEDSLDRNFAWKGKAPEDSEASKHNSANAVVISPQGTSTPDHQSVGTGITNSVANYNTAPLKMQNAASVRGRNSERADISTPESEASGGINSGAQTGRVNQGKKDIILNSLPDSLSSNEGIQHAFPTYKLYIIKSDTSEYRYSSMDDYFDYRLLQDVMVVRDKNECTHIMKARIIVDPRYISVAPDPRRQVGLYYQNNPIDSIRKLSSAPAPSQDINEELGFYLGKTPVRQGMRVCLKLGYHSDPRLLDTVFIGTITGLSGGMGSGSFELSAEGDGRELTVPATNHNRILSGETYAEIISSLIRVNPNIIHFGKVYGSVIKRMSYGQRKMFEFGLLGLPSLGGTFAGSLGAIGGVTAAWMAKTPVMIAGAAGLGIASGVVGYAGYKNTNALRMYGSPAWDEFFVRRIEESFFYQYWWGKYPQGLLGGKDIDGDGGYVNSFYKGKIGGLLTGRLYNGEMFSYQLSRHFYQVFRHGHNPIDDNIFAFEIWEKLGNSQELAINNRKTVWQVLQEIKRLYPNFALDVRPYGNRSTIFLGPAGSTYFRTDDPLLAMAPQLGEMDGMDSLYDQSAYPEQVRLAMTRFMAKTDSMGDIIARPKNIIEQAKDSPSGNNTSVQNIVGKVPGMAPMISFTKHHVITSDEHIISNGLKSTPERGFNSIVLTYSKDATKNTSSEPIEFVANQEIYPHAIRKKYEHADFTKEKSVATRYALGLLKEGVEKMYGGVIIIKGNAAIEPWDRILIIDKVNKIFGIVQAEVVIHKFDAEIGFTTHITPNLICEINDTAYFTMDKLLIEQAWRHGGSLLLNAAGGFAVGEAAGMVLGSVLGGAITAPALAVGGMAMTAYTSYKMVMEYKEKTSAAGINSTLQNNHVADMTRLVDKLSDPSSTSMEAFYFSKVTMEQTARMEGMKYGWALWYTQHAFKEMMGNDKAGLFRTIFSSDLRKDAYKVFTSKISKATIDAFNAAVVSPFKASKDALTGANKWMHDRAAIANLQKEIDGMGSRLKNNLEAINELKGKIDASKLKGELDKINTKIFDATLNPNEAIMKDAIQEKEAFIKKITDQLKKEHPNVNAETVVTTLMEDSVKVKAAALKGVAVSVTTPGAGIISKAKSGFGKAWSAGGKILGVGGKFMGPAFNFMTVASAEIFPMYMRTFAYNSVTKNNAITISPVWFRDDWLMNGLEGYDNTDLISHVGKIITNSKYRFDKDFNALRRYINESIPLVSTINPELNKDINSMPVVAFESAYPSAGNILCYLKAYLKFDNFSNNLSSFLKNLVNGDGAKTNTEVIEFLTNIDANNTPLQMRLFGMNRILNILARSPLASKNKDFWNIFLSMAILESKAGFDLVGKEDSEGRLALGYFQIRPTIHEADLLGILKTIESPERYIITIPGVADNNYKTSLSLPEFISNIDKYKYKNLIFSDVQQVIWKYILCGYVNGEVDSTAILLASEVTEKWIEKTYTTCHSQITKLLEKGFTETDTKGKVTIWAPKVTGMTADQLVGSDLYAVLCYMWNYGTSIESLNWIYNWLDKLGCINSKSFGPITNINILANGTNNNKAAAVIIKFFKTYSKIKEITNSNLGCSGNSSVPTKTTAQNSQTQASLSPYGKNITVDQIRSKINYIGNNPEKYGIGGSQSVQRDSASHTGAIDKGLLTYDCSGVVDAIFSAAFYSEELTSAQTINNVIKKDTYLAMVFQPFLSKTNASGMYSLRNQKPNGPKTTLLTGPSILSANAGDILLRIGPGNTNHAALCLGNGLFLNGSGSSKQVDPLKIKKLSEIKPVESATWCVIDVLSGVIK